jgi:hypothetical protein
MNGATAEPLLSTNSPPKTTIISKLALASISCGRACRATTRSGSPSRQSVVRPRFPSVQRRRSRRAIPTVPAICNLPQIRSRITGPSTCFRHGPARPFRARQLNNILRRRLIRLLRRSAGLLVRRRCYGRAIGSAYLSKK